VLIVDDDSGARLLLETHFRSIPGAEVIGSVPGAGEAYRFIMERMPDLVLLDVEMPGTSGFDLLADLKRVDLHPNVIFQTAYDKYAIRAIKNAAFDYLLKPVEREALLEALARFRASGSLQRLDKKIDALYHHLNQHRKLRFNTRQGFILIDPTELVYCKADWSYTELYFSDGTMKLATMNIGKIEQILDTDKFVRISRSVVINTAFLLSVNRKDHACTLSFMKEEHKFKLTGSHSRKLDVLTLG